MLSPEDLRREAEETERLAGAVNSDPDRAWLIAKAAELRHQAEKADARQAARRHRPRLN